MKKNLFLIAVATAVVAACSSDLDETSVVESCPVRLSVDGLTGMTRAGQSVQLTQFANGQQVGIFLVENGIGTNMTAYPQPLTYTVDGSGKLTPTATQYWPTDGNGLNIYGIYPATAATNCNATTNFSVQTNQTTDANYMASDLMTGIPASGNPVARTTSAVAMTFTHLLTKIDVNLTAGSGFETSDLTSVTTSVLGTRPTATFNIQSATVSTADVAAAAITAGTGVSNSAIIVPQTVDANTDFIQVTIGGGNYIYKLPAATTFAPSTKYTYNLTVTKTGLTLSGTTITPWDAATAAVIGDAESVQPDPIDLSMVDCAGNKRDSRWTANCYMVHNKGKYLVPLVYGNAIRNGTVNTVAYKPGGSGSQTYCSNFQNHAGNNISAPWITKSTSGTGVNKGMGITVSSAELIWQDAMGLIKEVGIDGDFLTLTVGKNATVQEGNALIAAKSGNTIVWSWHIWVTRETFTTLTAVNTGSHTYQVTPVNVGWVGDAVSRGYCPYYQWGRKEPFIPSDGVGSNGYNQSYLRGINHTVYDISNNAVSRIIYHAGDGSTALDIKNPYRYYSNSGLPYSGEKHHNRWDAKQTGSSNNTATATKKTVLDPCPPGFCVPTSNLYYYIKNNVPVADFPWDGTNKGRTLTGVTPNVFFPAAGHRIDADLYDVGVNSYLWSATSSTNNSDKNSWLLFFKSNSVSLDNNEPRAKSCSIRAVAEE